MLFLFVILRHPNSRGTGLRIDRLCTKITSSYDVNNFRNIELNFQENAQQKTVGLTSDGNQIPVVIERDSSNEILTVWVS